MAAVPGSTTGSSIASAHSPTTATTAPVAVPGGRGPTSPIARATGLARPGRGRHRALAVVLAAGLCVSLVAGCGDDDDRSGDDGGDTGTDAGADGEDWLVADGVTLEVTVRANEPAVVLSYTITNVGAAPVAVVDPASGSEREGTDPDGGLRVAYLAPEAASGGGDVPEPGVGVLVTPGGTHEGEADALTRPGDTVPERLDVCVEVVADPQADDDADGIVTFPPRSTDDPPTVACSGPVDVAPA